MKKWRKDAEKHNAEAGRKHQGRKHKPLNFTLPKYVSMTKLLRGMFQRSGLPVVYGG